MTEQTDKEAVEEVTSKIVNPLLARVHLPGETYRLPSGGLFYNNGELSKDVIDGEIHIRPMAAFDEILLRTPDLLLSGKGVEEVISRCCSQVLKPDQLLSKDVDHILVCLRNVTYGQHLEVNYTHTCKDAKSHSYMIDVDKIIREAKAIDPTSITKTFKKTLVNGQVVEMHPARFADAIKMMQAYNPSEQLSPEQELASLMDTIMSVIKSVDEVEDEAFIREWLTTIKSDWVNDLYNAIQDTSDFGPSFMYKTKCRDCGKDIEIVAPINPISFFS